jgi:hypothetical protein
MLGKYRAIIDGEGSFPEKLETRDVNQMTMDLLEEGMREYLV